MKSHVDKMPRWQNVMLTKFHVDKCHADKMSLWQIATLIKYHVDKMSCWRNIMLMIWLCTFLIFSRPSRVLLSASLTICKMWMHSLDFHIFYGKFRQEILTEEEVSVKLAPLYLLIQNSCFSLFFLSLQNKLS